MKRNQKAWLLTWEWTGDHAAVEDKIAGILRPRLSWEIVGTIVESLYSIHEYSVSELAYYSRRPKENPYVAQWHNSGCFCGHNPSLHANYVHKLNITEDRETGLETIVWVLPPLYTLNRTTFERELIREEIARSATRTITGPLSSKEIGRYHPE